jgi:hypothetical protein
MSLRFVTRSLSLAALLVASNATAGVIADENAKTGITGNWTAGDDGTARFTGDVDIYPADWSISPGDPLRLKVRSKSTYDVRVMRLGYYGGASAREIKLVSGNAANAQPYPTPDAKSGLAEAKWAVTVTINDTGSWTPGLYVARAETSTGKQAVTIFAVRDDKLATKLPYLLVIGTATHQAYNAWPGPAGTNKDSPDDAAWVGKSLYGFNSSTAHPSESIGTLRQAVRVSFDRPFFVGGGTADISVYEYPLLRWAEKNGYDMAVATDVDLHLNPGLLSGRKLAIFSGHEEYVSWQMFDNAIAARKAGVNFLFLSGDTWSWQVRFEPGSAGGTSTLVGYKESWVKDPEQKTAYSLKLAGKIEEAKSHYRLVTRGWKNLENDPATGIDERRPGMSLTGVQSSGIIRDAAGVGMHGGLYPWADLIVTASSHWIYAGTGLTNGSKIANVFGYEVDSTMASSPEFDKWRQPGQIVLGAIKQVSDGTVKGSAATFRDPSGAEVVAMSAIYTSWALDDWGWKTGGFAGKPNPVDANYQKMIKNVFDRYASGVAPAFDAGPLLDAGSFDVGPVADADEIEKDVGTIPDVEAIDVADVGAADTMVVEDTFAPQEAAADAVVVGDAPTPENDTGTVGVTENPAVVEETASGCGCTTAGSGARDLSMVGIAAAALAIASRRRRR